MNDRWSRMAPLTGVLFGVLVVVAILTNNSESPEAKAGPLKVIAYYTKHRSEVQTSAIAFGLAFLALLLFAGALRSYLRRTATAEGLSSMVLAGGVLMAAGALVGTGVEYGLAHNIHSLGLQEARTLNFLSQELFLPILGGAFVFGVCSGIAILRGAALPNWLGWVAIVLGIAAIIPPASLPSLLGFVIWSIIVAILIYQRTGEPTQAPPEPSAVAASGV